MKEHKWDILYIVGLVGFTAYLALDTFLIPGVYQSDATEMNLSAFEAAAKQVQSEESGPEDANAKAAMTGKEADGKTPAAADQSGEKTTANADQTAGKTQSSAHKKRPGSGNRQRQKEREAGSSESVTTKQASASDSYQDENMAITLTEYTTNDTKVYVADVKLSSAQYLKTAFAQDTYGKNVTDETSAIAKEHNAILTVNGDYYGARNTGYVIRNGIVYRDEPSDADLLCIYADGSMKITDQSSVSASQLAEEGVWQAFSFGPALLTDAQIAVTQDEETGKAMASNPRTAIGIIDDLHYLFVVSDGRTDESAGLSLYELADFMKQLGVKTAYNLDGGGSSTMVFQGRVINQPTTTGNSIKERKVSDIVYIG